MKIRKSLISLRVIAPLSVLAATALLTSQASAQITQTWNGVTSGSWDLGANWTTSAGVSGTTPGNTNSGTATVPTNLVFGTSPGTVANQPSGPASNGNDAAGASWTFQSSTGGWTIGTLGVTSSELTTNGAFTIDDSLQTSGTNFLNFNDLRLHGTTNASINVGTGGTLVMNAALNVVPTETTDTFVKVGAGTLMLNKTAMDASGTTPTKMGFTFTAGKVVVGANNAFGNLSGTDTLTWNGSGTMAASGTGAFTIGSVMTVSAAAIAFSGSGSLDFGPSVTLSSTVTTVTMSNGGTVGWRNNVAKGGASLNLILTAGDSQGGMLRLGSNNAFTALTIGTGINVQATNNTPTTLLGSGIVTMSGGTLSNAFSGTVSYANSLVITNSMSVSGSGVSATTFTGSVSLNAVSADNTATITNAGAAATTFSGVIGNGGTGAGSVILNGSGTVIFGGANTYSGNTTVNAGTLLVKGSLAGTGTVTVAGGATLGVGKAAGASTFGTLNAAAISLTTGSTFSTVNLTLGNVGNTDSLAASGGISIAGGSTINLVLTLDSGVSDLSGNYILLAWGTGSAVDPSQVDLTGSTLQIQLDLINGSYSLLDVGNSLQLVSSAVPEPATWALFGCGLILTGWTWRKRRQTTLVQD